jgi:hypothetical protein
VQPCGLLPPRVRLRARVHPRCALRKHLRLSLLLHPARAVGALLALHPFRCGRHTPNNPWVLGISPVGHAATTLGARGHHAAWAGPPRYKAPAWIIWYSTCEENGRRRTCEKNVREQELCESGTIISNSFLLSLTLVALSARFPLSS